MNSVEKKSLFGDEDFQSLLENYNHVFDNKFQLVSSYRPSGDQPEAIRELVDNIRSGVDHQTLLGVTGSGKTFTMANVIASVNRPAIIMAHNKTLAAQLYGEMKSFFPYNAVEYFVSFYDYYIPEAYIPTTDTYIEKDSALNEHIEQMRLSATRSLLLRNDVIIVATVSAIYGLGDPMQELKMMLPLKVGQKMSQRTLLRSLVSMQYQRDDFDLSRGTFRVRGDVVDIFPSSSDQLVLRVELFDDEIEKLYMFDPLINKKIGNLDSYVVFPKTHYVTTQDTLAGAVEQIKDDLQIRRREFIDENKLVEEQRITQRTNYDIEMILEIGTCKGIENYSRYLSGRKPGSAPPCLLDYMPDDSLMFIDESHVTVPQIGAMYLGDRSRKLNLVNYGFRLPSALDNRPLTFDEFSKIAPQTIYVSATPADYELEQSQGIVVEQVVRPTGLLDPVVEVRPAQTQVDDVMSEIRAVTARGERILITTLTKRMAEELTDFLHENGVKVRYLHSEVKTVERVEIINDLRTGTIDVLVGINLLREGLDIPEVSLVAIMDADKEGFLRSGRSLIQTIGRAARNINGKAILYADSTTKSMQTAIDETARRRKKQEEYNRKNGIVPKQIVKSVEDILNTDPDGEKKSKKGTKGKNSRVKNAASTEKKPETVLAPNEIESLIKEKEQKMKELARNLEFERAAEVRDEIAELRNMLMTVS